MLTLILTWPLGNLSQPRLPDHDDAMFSVWRLAWIAHQLTEDPSKLFDANIFWPARNTLAFSDAMLLLGIVGAPLIWLGLHPITVHNILLLAAFVTAGLGAARLMRYFTPSQPAQMITAIIFAFAPYRFAHVGHLELLWTAFLPLSLLGVYQVLEQPTIRRGLGLGLAVGLQALCSVYYFLFLVIWLVPATLFAIWHVHFRWTRQHLTAGAVAVATAAVLIAPYVTPYSRARADLPSRDDAEVQRYSATPSDYLRTSGRNRFYPEFKAEAPDERSLFVGLIALTLAVVAVVLVRTRAAVAMALLSVIAFDLSLGLNGFAYTILRDSIPSLGGFRAPARFGVFVLLAVAVLAGLGMAYLFARATPRQRRMLSAAIVAGLTVEYWSAPLVTRTMPTTAPLVYQWLATQPPSVVVLEWPLPTPQTLWLYETSHQYFSIYHWQSLVNGYSGYAPPSYVQLLEQMDDFPSDQSVALLRERNVSLVIFHKRYLDAEEFERLRQACTNPAWFTERMTFQDTTEWESVACRIAPAT